MILKKKTIIEWEQLGNFAQSQYLEKARYLQEKGYVSETMDRFKIAERMYYSELKEKLKGESANG